MSAEIIAKIEELKKAWELGSYNVQPTALSQGPATNKEDLSKVMHNVTFGEKDVKLQKELKVEKTKSQLVQFVRQLSHGTFGGTAMAEGLVGQEDTPDVIRAAVPMAYYSMMARHTDAAEMADTFDGVSASDRLAASAALKVAGDVEFDVFRGKADFSNGGVFDGNPGSIPDRMANLLGLDVQIRQSDYSIDTQDLMFEAFGSSLSNVIAGGGTLTQSMIEDTWIRGVMNFSKADRAFTDPLVLSNYSKQTYLDKIRFNLGAAAQEPTTGVDIRKQAVSGGVVTLETSRFLSGQTKPKRPRNNAPSAPTISSVTVAASSTGFLATQVYTYYVTGENELGESLPSAASTGTIVNNGDKVTLALAAGGSGTTRWFNVFRSPAGGSVASCKLIGRVKSVGGASFVDLGNMLPGASNLYLVDPESMGLHELAPFFRAPLAKTDLTSVTAFARFVTLAVYQPRKNVLCSNLTGAL
jgi:hypothetical protein